MNWFTRTTVPAPDWSIAWFTGLELPTTQQVAFASTIWGGAAAWFGFYVQTGGNNSAN